MAETEQEGKTRPTRPGLEGEPYESESNSVYVLGLGSNSSRFTLLSARYFYILINIGYHICSISVFVSIVSGSDFKRNKETEMIELVFVRFRTVFVPTQLLHLYLNFFIIFKLAISLR